MTPSGESEMRGENMMSDETTKVRARCVACAAERDIAPGEIPEGEQPMCVVCFSPMVAHRATAATANKRKAGTR